ncbi:MULTISPECIES: tetratricopeptide repeat protein [Streptosporangium]|uniref:Tetratricopeptide (TPR) repeat protein n=1 Tax=Streptosporangium brasiliense TaxID=47480 RepID=A0ABT9QZH3_9ACTN|nr:tetratricopeptide repeat protein [Streptosporangium brasiliense]MDP9862352.1 tetratricopeptide (TPR) repeat protein [Streptosporangium brasiliense]
MGNHYWLTGARRRDRDRARQGLDLPPTLAVLDAHRRLRGPYTAAGALIRSIAAEALALRPELGPAHNIELLTSTPELAGVVPPAWATLEWSVGEKERTRFYSRLHTLNISNGLAEFLRDYLAAAGGGPRTLVLENMHQADPTDQEFAAVLLRRSDLGALTVVVGTGPDPVADPPGEIAVSLARVLAAHAEPVDCPATTGSPAGDARDYVDSDGTSDEPELLAAYRRLAPEERARLHDERAALLAGRGEFSLLLGAVPYHAEHGGDPRGAGLAAMRQALQHCKDIGLYQAAVELGQRARAIVDRPTQEELWWYFTNSTSTCMASLGRADEAEAIYDEARGATQDPVVHMDLAYGTAMLYARHYPEERRDYQQARAWMNLSVAIASLLGDRKERAFHSVFANNGLALVEVRQQSAEVALRLLEDGMARLDRELEPGEHALHRAVLRYNRAQVFGMTGRLEEALADYAAVVELDPDFPEHHFNIGNILRRLGRDEEAVASYERALRLSPPFPEAYYNLADARLELGDVQGALADFLYTIELDPEHVDAHVNLAGLLHGLDDGEAAWRVTAAGLALAPDNAHLLCLKGKLLAERGEAGAARTALSAALQRDPGLAEAWAARGELAFEAGDLAGATGDLDRAVELAGTPAIRFNRAVVYQEAARYAEAAADYGTVLTVVDDAEARERLEACLKAAAM